MLDEYFSPVRAFFKHQTGTTILVHGGFTAPGRPATLQSQPQLLVGDRAHAAPAVDLPSDADQVLREGRKLSPLLPSVPDVYLPLIHMGCLDAEYVSDNPPPGPQLRAAPPLGGVPIAPIL